MFSKVANVNGLTDQGDLHHQSLPPHSVNTKAKPHEVDERHGMSEVEFQVYVQDCKESASMCADAHRYFLNSPDVLSNFF